LARALHDNVDDSQNWLHSFASIVQQQGEPSSHTLAKQIYFPLPDGRYHLLAPLYPTALVHSWHETLKHDRFSDASKAARKAHKEQRQHEHGYAEYLNLAMQKFGGAQPQNISLLNSARRGEAYLLASFPPTWQRQPLSPPTQSTSVFKRFGAFARQGHVIGMTKGLKGLGKYLESQRGRTSTVDIRQERANRIDQILDALFTYQDTIRSLPPGWSLEPTCKLDKAECLWLDPDASDDDDLSKQPSKVDHDDAMDDAPESQLYWPREIALRFATWLNAAISTPDNPMADEEHKAWSKRAQIRLVGEAQQ
jgi:CRISPR-associated protein Csy1